MTNVMKTVATFLAAMIMAAGNLFTTGVPSAQARDRGIILRHGPQSAHHWQGRQWQGQGGRYRPGAVARHDFHAHGLYRGRYPGVHYRYVPRTYHGWRYRDDYLFGPGLAAGVLSGVILGGIIDPYDGYDYGPVYGIVPPQVYVPRRAYRVAGVSQAHVDWCYARYRSYRAYDNTFQPYHGPRRPCYSPY